MCAILDANSMHEVFGANRAPAGDGFRSAIENGRVRLVAGGRLLQELDRNVKFRMWRREAQCAGRVRIVDYQEVQRSTESLEKRSSCRSDDEHVVALAQISGARLLYTNDKDLQTDFKDRKLLDHPRGNVYSTSVSEKFGNRHRRLPGMGNLCNRSQ